MARRRPQPLALVSTQSNGVQNWRKHMKTEVVAKFVAVVAFAVVLGSPLVSCKSMYPTEPREQTGARATNVRKTSVQDGAAIRSQAEVFTAATDIRAELDAYRAALGTLNPN